MSELTYKKIVDVEQIETLNNAATVFINDNGAMKQVAANEFGLGTVKTVNGIEPDENGNIKSDIAVPVLITHLKFPMFDDIKCNKTYEELHHSFLTQSTEATSIALCLYTALDKSEEYRYCTNFVLEKDNGEFTKRYFLYFGEDIAPYIIDVEANTITLDPNWVASTACVKTVNGVAPDEDGDLTIVEPQTFVFTNIDGDVDCPYDVSELIQFATNASAYKSVRFVHRVRDLFDPSVPIRDYVWTGASIPATGTGVFKINFGDEIAPILINSNANTITLDPDWIKPEENVQPDWNQNDETAPDYVKNRTHYNNQFRQVINLDPAKDFYHTTGGYHIGGSGSLDPTEKNNGYAIGDYFLSKQQLAIFPGIVKFDDIVIEFTGPRRLPVTFRLTNNEFPQFQFHQHGSQIGCDILYADNKPHTFEWIDTHFAETVPLDEKYIPSTIARKSDLEALGGVKTVNNVAPDTAGNVKIPGFKLIQFMDMSSFGGGVRCSMSAEEAFTNVTGNESLTVYRRIWLGDDDGNPKDAYTMSVSRNDTTMVIDFDDGRAPIIVDATTNTITLDPDWVAPTACVKTVNGIEPDENGEVKATELIQFTDYSAIVPGRILYGGTYTMQEIVDKLFNGEHQRYKVVISILNPMNGIRTDRKVTAYEQIVTGDDRLLTGVKLYYGDEACPIILDGVSNTITLDPDWIAPEANITESAANTLVDTKVAELSTTVDTKLAELAAQELSLPKSAGVVDHGTAGQFAVSDGMGGIMWKTLVEVEEVAY